MSRMWGQWDVKTSNSKFCTADNNIRINPIIVKIKNFRKKQTITNTLHRDQREVNIIMEVVQ